MKSIRQQLTLTLMLGFTLLLGAGGLAIYFFTRAELLREFDAGLRTKALTLVALTEQHQDGLHIELPENLSHDFNNDAATEFFQLWRADGTTCKRSESLKGADLPRRFGPRDKPAYWNLNLPRDSDGRAIGLKFSPRADDDDAASKHVTTREAILVVAADRRSLDQTLGTLATVLAATGLLILLVTVPVVRFSLRRGHAPLEQLARQAAGITADSLQTRFPVNRMPAELLPITTRLNDLLNRLEASFERERRFSADLAHELRTPLAELRSHAEVEMKWSEGGESEQHRETLEIALQMEAMVTRLLELSRCEQGKLPIEFNPVLIAPLVEEVWRSQAVKAGQKQLAVNFNIPAGAVIETDRTLFRSILTNLFSNAVDYSPQGGRVEIGWRTEANELTVSNTVHDLSADDLPHLFERLWRKDKSRTGSEHYGLGLSVSRAFAQLLGLNLEARFSDQTTLTLALRAVK
jgi:two-component system, OmpR family, heavy metal sensor histidine kinase CusS